MILERPELHILPERFVVEVTADDILHGQPCDAATCPLALAVTRWLRQRRIPFLTVSVGFPDVNIYLDNRTLPRRHYWHDAFRFVSDFDHGAVVKPRTVVLAKLP